MLKKSLIAIAVLAVAMPVFAGQLKIHDPWPTAPVPQEICKIDVVLNVGYWIQIVDQTPIKVVQDTAATNPFQTYKGCKTTDVKTNFACTLSVSAAAVGAAGGSWSATVAPSAMIAGTNAGVSICANGSNVDIGKLTGGAKNVKVAEVTVKVVPV